MIVENARGGQAERLSYPVEIIAVEITHLQDQRFFRRECAKFGAELIMESDELNAIDFDLDDDGLKFNDRLFDL